MAVLWIIAAWYAFSQAQAFGEPTIDLYGPGDHKYMKYNGTCEAGTCWKLNDKRENGEKEMSFGLWLPVLLVGRPIVSGFLTFFGML